MVLSIIEEIEKDTVWTGGLRAYQNMTLGIP